MTGRQEYNRTKDRQRTLDKYMINSSAFRNFDTNMTGGQEYARQRTLDKYRITKIIKTNKAPFSTIIYFFLSFGQLASQLHSPHSKVIICCSSLCVSVTTTQPVMLNLLNYVGCLVVNAFQRKCSTSKYSFFDPHGPFGRVQKIKDAQIQVLYS